MILALTVMETAPISHNLLVSVMAILHTEGSADPLLSIALPIVRELAKAVFRGEFGGATS